VDATFLFDNLMMAANVIEASRQAVSENRWFEVMCRLPQIVWLRLHFCAADQSLRAGDNFRPEHSHVLPR
jgi:hypothetical protein